jgi:hypothetical protein
MPAIESVLQRLGYVKLDRFGLVLTPEGRIMSLRPAVLDDGLGGKIVGWQEGDLAAMELEKWEPAVPASQRAVAARVATTLLPKIPPIPSIPGTAVPSGPARPSVPAPVAQVAVPAAIPAPRPAAVIAPAAVVAAPAPPEDDDWEWTIALARARVAAEEAEAAAQVATQPAPVRTPTPAPLTRRTRANTVPPPPSTAPAEPAPLPPAPKPRFVAAKTAPMPTIAAESKTKEMPAVAIDYQSETTKVQPPPAAAQRPGTSPTTVIPVPKLPSVRTTQASRIEPVVRTTNTNVMPRRLAKGTPAPLSQDVTRPVAQIADEDPTVPGITLPAAKPLPRIVRSR